MASLAPTGAGQTVLQWAGRRSLSFLRGAHILPPDLLRRIARAAGVDVFTGQVILRDVESFTLSEAAQTTRLLYLGDADEFLQSTDYQSLDRP